MNRQSKSEEVLVWGWEVRVFHWCLVFLLCTLWLTAQFSYHAIHVLFGYLLMALIFWRCAWGIWGQGYSRFSSFLFSFQHIQRYVKTLMAGHPTRYLGHNPLGGLMVFTLLGLLSIQSLLGLLIQGVIDFAGPFQWLGVFISDSFSYGLFEAHDAMQYVFLGLVGLHLLGVYHGSQMHHENLIKSMVTGFKKQHLDKQ